MLNISLKTNNNGDAPELPRSFKVSAPTTIIVNISDLLSHVTIFLFNTIPEQGDLIELR